ncbi:MAG: NDP-sugar synthase [Actinomycetota bacterium]|nr:NDP-sugar synthase [Actinomycetota bacterium]
MRALILAGGYGTRLRPLTFTRPKHMLPIANRPHIDHVLELLRKHGIHEVVMLTSYLAEAFREVLDAAEAAGMAVRTTFEKEPLGTAGAIKFAQDFVGEETFVVFNGDILTDVDLGEVIRFHRDRRAEATIALYPVDDPSIYGVVPTDEEGRVLGFVEKPPREKAPTNLINAGIYVFEPSVLNRIEPGKPWSAERQLFPDLVAQKAEFFATAIEAYWMDIGTPEKFLQANLDALSGRYLSDIQPDRDGVLAADDSFVHPSARVSDTCLGADARIEKEASVAESVLLPEAVVEGGATVKRSILGLGARVGGGVPAVEQTLADGDKLFFGAIEDS